MTTPGEEGVTVHLYRSAFGEWGVFITTDHTADHYWEEGAGVPTQLARSEVLRKLGYEVVSQWLWKEWPMQPQTHSLHAEARVRRLAPACRNCGKSFDPTDTRFDGAAQDGDKPFCRSCTDRCHDTEIADHRCVVCA